MRQSQKCQRPRPGRTEGVSGDAKPRTLSDMPVVERDGIRPGRRRLANVSDHSGRDTRPRRSLARSDALPWGSSPRADPGRARRTPRPGVLPPGRSLGTTAAMRRSRGVGTRVRLRHLPGDSDATLPTRAPSRQAGVRRQAQDSTRLRGQRLPTRQPRPTTPRRAGP